MRETFLPYARPSIGSTEIERVVESMRNGWLTTGPSVNALEEAFSAASGIPNAVGLNSCTAALHLGLVAMGVQAGDEVVMPSLTFVAGAQCTRELGATPVFADVDAHTLMVTAESVAAVTTNRTRCIVPVHYAGRPAPIEEIVAFARPRGIRVLEDAAHSVGMLASGNWAGALSDGAAYSFYATKNMTSGEGGIFLTNHADIAARVRCLSLHGMSRDAWKRYTTGGSWRYDVVEPGYKYNLSDIAAAIALAQLERIEELQRQREHLARLYIEKLGRLRGIRIVTEFLDAPDRHAWCMFVIAIESGAGISRDDFIERLRESNIGTSVHYIPTHQFSAYKELSAHVPVTDDVWKNILSLPLYPGMTDADVDDVVEAIATILGGSTQATKVA